MPPEWNWARSHQYAAEQVRHPCSLAELQDLVAGSRRIRALGTRHSFTDLADTPGVLACLDRLPGTVRLDQDRATVTAPAAMRYGELAVELEKRGWALHNLASLPHIGVAGAIATGTHGSGDGNVSLSGAVTRLDLVGADGQRFSTARGDDDFDGSVVSLGALGIVTHVTLEVVPSFQLGQVVFAGLPFGRLVRDFDAITASAYSVSLFTDWSGDRVAQVWVKSRQPPTAGDFFGARRLDRPTHMLPGGWPGAATDQSGSPGPWLDRLPHFRMGFTPSSGEELQSEYLLPRAGLSEAVEAMRALAPRMATALQMCEIRTVAADSLWLSPAHGGPVVGLHFTWRHRAGEVYALLPRLEAALLPLGARPHWGKCFTATAAELRGAYPRLTDFRRLRDRRDPEGKFGNPFLDRALALPHLASQPSARPPGMP